MGFGRWSVHIPCRSPRGPSKQNTLSRSDGVIFLSVVCELARERPIKNSPVMCLHITGCFCLRKDWDSNPGAALGGHTLSRRDAINKVFQNKVASTYFYCCFFISFYLFLLMLYIVLRAICESFGWTRIFKPAPGDTRPRFYTRFGSESIVPNCLVQ